MIRHHISGATDSFIISTGGCLLVLDTSFSRAVSAFELTPTCVPVMSKSSRVANIFALPGTWNNPLHVLNDGDVLKHPYTEFNHFVIGMPLS